MEPINNNFKQRIEELNVADVLYSAGYLAPRNEKDMERFEKIYAGRTFETEEYNVDVDAIFDKVRGEKHEMVRKIRPVKTIYDRPGMLLVAETISKEPDVTVAEALNNLLKEKKD